MLFELYTNKIYSKIVMAIETIQHTWFDLTVDIKEGI